MDIPEAVANWLKGIFSLAAMIVVAWWKIKPNPEDKDRTMIASATKGDDRINRSDLYEIHTRLDTQDKEIDMVNQTLARALEELVQSRKKHEDTIGRQQKHSESTIRILGEIASHQARMTDTLSTLTNRVDNYRDRFEQLDKVCSSILAVSTQNKDNLIAINGRIDRWRDGSKD